MKFARRSLSAALAGSLLTLLAACGAGSGTTTSAPASSNASPSGASSSQAGSPSASPSAATFPVTVTGANGPLTLAKAPTHIVSMSPTATEMLYAIGAGAQVVAVDDNSNYPTNAPKTKLSAFEPSAEAVAGYSPDLVVLSNDSKGFLAALGKLKVPALMLPAAAKLDDVYTQLQTLGQATGHPAEAAKVSDDTKSRIAAAIASIPASAKGKKIYHELDQTFYSVTSDTFLGGLYKLMGLTDIADTAKGAAAAGGYPQLSAEFIVAQAPDVIVLADTKCCQQSVASLAKRPGFAAIPAVKNGAVLAADDDIASRWGPRVADFVEAVAKLLQSH